MGASSALRRLRGCRLRVPGAALIRLAPTLRARPPWAALLLLLLALAGGPAGETARREAQAAPASLPSVFEERPTAPAGGAPSDPALRARFLAQYRKTASADRRRLFAAYLPTLGVAGILGAIEQAAPNCHDEAHELGKAAYALTHDMPTILQSCSTRCVSGCMHGVLMEAFTEKPAGLRARVATLCDEPAMRRIHKRGDCVHGVGHGAAYVTEYDLPRAIDLCEVVGERAYQYYCASGAYMQFFMAFQPKIAARTDQYPCDEASRFAAACYRYEVFFMLERLQRVGKGLEALLAECLALPARVQPACFHGVGHVHVGTVAQTPPRIREVCGRGRDAAQWLCIQGVVEKLAELDQPLARRVCGELTGRNAEVCVEAARNKLYATHKVGIEHYFVGY